MLYFELQLDPSQPTPVVAQNLADPREIVKICIARVVLGILVFSRVSSACLQCMAIL